MPDPQTNATMQALSRDLAAIVERSRPTAVAIRAGRYRASGMVWRAGFVVTACETLPEDGDVSVTLASGETRAAICVGRDPGTDIALLSVDNIPGMPLPAGGTASVGALVLALGADKGGAVATLGVVAAAGPAWRSLRGGQIDARIELDARLHRIGEGALVLDAAGGLIGMAVSGPRHRVLVIPTATIDRVGQELATHGAVRRGYLGIGFHPVELDGGGAGLMAMNIAPGGPADAAGLKQGDILIGWNGTPIVGLHGLMGALGPESVGRAVKLALRRGGSALEAAITIGTRP